MTVAPATTWIDLVEGEDDVAGRLAELDLPGLAVEDVLEADQRPKVEDYGDDLLFFILDAVVYDDAVEKIRFHQVRVFLTHDLVVTVRPPQVETMRALRARHVRGQLEGWDAARIVHAVIDGIIDRYQPALFEISDDIEEVEADVFSDEWTNPSARIYGLKRQVLEFLRHTSPLLIPLERLRAEQHDVFPDELDELIRDVEDHLRRVVHQLEQFSDLLTTVLEANLSQLSVRQNEDMRRMSAWAAIFLVPTLMAGVWGMNFDNMPEADWTFGYPVALLAMICVSGLLYLRLRKAGWL